MVDQRPLINFTRCAKLLQRIDDIRRYHPAPAPVPSPSSPSPPTPPPAPPAGPPPGKTKTKDKDKDKRRSSASNSTSTVAAPIPAAAALAWVKLELDKAPKVIAREQFEGRVSELAEIERRMRERRDLELRSLGFGTPVPRHHRSSSSGSPSSARSLGGGRVASLDSRFGMI